MPVFAGPPQRVSQPGTLARGRPQWSSDGTELAYEVRESDQSFVEITSLSTGESRRGELPGVRLKRSHLSWSPSGGFFAYLDADEPGNPGELMIWVKKVDGGPARQVTRHESEDYFPGWSPDGSSIVFASTRSGGVTIWTVSTDGGSPTRLVETPDVSSPRWSPDGEWLAFSSYGSHVPPRIWLMHRSKTKPVVLTTGGNIIQWSPHGQTLFFSRSVTGVEGSTSARSELWTVDVKNRSERQLTNLSGRPGRLGRLATDGTYLYFLWNEDLGDIWVMDVVTDESE